MSEHTSLHVEKHLLSLLTSGCYINTKELVNIGKILNIKLPYKKRSFLLRALLQHAKEHQLHAQLLTLICGELDKKHHELSSLAQNYPASRVLLQKFLINIHTTKLLLRHELALHVGDNSDA